jgi:hypothetical protein
LKIGLTSDSYVMSAAETVAGPTVRPSAASNRAGLIILDKIVGLDIVSLEGMDRRSGHSAWREG